MYTYTDFVEKRPVKSILKEFIFAENVDRFCLLLDQSIPYIIGGWNPENVNPDFDSTTQGVPVLLFE